MACVTRGSMPEPIACGHQAKDQTKISLSPPTPISQEPCARATARPRRGTRPRRTARGPRTPGSAGRPRRSMIAAGPLQSSRIDGRGRSRCPPAGIGSPERRACCAPRGRSRTPALAPATGGLRRLADRIDLIAVSLALYISLVSKQIYRGSPVFWGVLWKSATDVLPFVILIVGLVFAKNGLYRSRESRPGGSAIVASLAFATLIVALFALVTGARVQLVRHVLRHVRARSRARDRLRASYDSATLALMRSLGMRRRTVLAGRAEALDELYSALSRAARRPRARDDRHGLRRAAARRRPRAARRDGRPARARARAPARRPRARRAPSCPTGAARARRRLPEHRARACASCRRRPSCCSSARASCRARPCRCSSCARRC